MEKIIDNEININGFNVYITNDPYKLCDDGKALKRNLVEVSMVSNGKWARMFVTKEMLNYEKTKDYILMQLRKIAKNAG